MNHLPMQTVHLTPSEKHIALDIMETDYDSIPFAYRSPMTRALKHNLSIKPEIRDWLWDNNPGITIQDPDTIEFKVDTTDDEALKALAEFLIEFTKELDNE